MPTPATLLKNPYAMTEMSPEQSMAYNQAMGGGPNGAQQAGDEYNRTINGTPSYMVPGNSQPIRPQYTPGYDPKTMGISGDLQGWLTGLDPNQAGLNKFRSEAMRTGPSAWADLARGQQDQEQMNQQNQAARQSGATGAEARSQLAMSGGLTGGARERIARDQGRNYLGMSQNITQQGAANRTQIGINDEQNRISQLGQLPGMENANSQFGLNKAEILAKGKQFDIGNQTQETGRKNDFALGNYHEQMAAWGAGQQANATANSGKK